MVGDVDVDVMELQDDCRCKGLNNKGVAASDEMEVAVIVVVIGAGGSTPAIAATAIAAAGW